jgi:hypothetical protein
VTENAIRRQIKARVIERGDDGLIDFDLADAAWYRTHLARQGQASIRDQGGVELAAARIAWAKARLADEIDRLNDLKERYTTARRCACAAFRRRIRRGEMIDAKGLESAVVPGRTSPATMTQRVDEVVDRAAEPTNRRAQLHSAAGFRRNAPAPRSRPH